MPTKPTITTSPGLDIDAIHAKRPPMPSTKRATFANTTGNRLDNLGDVSLAVLAIVKAKPAISTQQVQAEFATQYPELTWRHNACSCLGTRGFLVNPNGCGRPANWYTREQWAAAQAAAQAAPVQATREDGQPLPAWLAMPTKRTSPDLSRWVPPRHEVARPEGLRAFDCPSRDGDKLKPYTGPKPCCVGTGLGIYGPGRAGSAARGVV